MLAYRPDFLRPHVGADKGKSTLYVNRPYICRPPWMDHCNLRVTGLIQSIYKTYIHSTYESSRNRQRAVCYAMPQCNAAAVSHI